MAAMQDIMKQNVQLHGELLKMKTQVHSTVRDLESEITTLKTKNTDLQRTAQEEAELSQSGIEFAREQREIYELNMANLRT